ncbi:hypothetical protein QYB59_000023 [Clostridium perfringens]|nr:hypothetical protein [Clostridium perfringens]
MCNIMILLIIGFLVIIMAALVTTYILVDMFKEKSYLDDRLLFIYMFAITAFEWASIILIIREMII